MTLRDVRRFALSLPQATEAPHFHLTSFRVRGRIFATAPPESDYLHVFLDESARHRYLTAEPDFVEILSWGKKAEGLRVILAAAKAGVVHAMLREAWRAKAPKRLIKEHDLSTGSSAFTQS